MPKEAASISKSIGDKIEYFLGGIMGWSEMQLVDFPDVFAQWLEDRRFVYGVADPARPEHDQINYGEFWAWARTSLFSLIAWVFMFEFYAMALGHSVDNPTVFVWVTGVGVLFFLVTLLAWLSRVIRRIDTALYTTSILVSLGFFALFFGAPLLQLFSSASAPGTKDFWTQPDLYVPLLQSIARAWAVLGFALSCLLIAPLVWTGLIGPVILSVIAKAGAKKVDQAYTLIRQLLPLGTPASNAARGRPKANAAHQVSSAVATAPISDGRR